MSQSPFKLILLGKPTPAAQRNQFNAIPKRQRDAIAYIRAAASREMQGREMLSGPLELQLVVCVPIPTSKPKKWKAAAARGEEWPITRPDMKNFTWLVEDALTSIVYADDSLVCRHQTEKRYDERPRIEILVSPIPVAGEVDHKALSREFMARFPKIRAALAE